MQSILNEPIVTNTVTPIGLNQIIHGDCLDVLGSIPDKSIDLVLTDPPYGTTACKWDTIVPFEPMWEQLERVIKDNGAIVMTASQPFTSALVMSNPELFKYEWIWDKITISNPMLAKYQPLKQHESVLVFGKKKTTYQPQKTDLHIISKWKQYKQNKDATSPATVGRSGVSIGKYPKSIIRFKAAKLEGRTVHPTQKSIELWKYLLKTYSLEGDTILDPFAGSCTTAVACKELNRNYICIEKEAEYVEIGKKRLDAINTSPGTNS